MLIRCWGLLNNPQRRAYHAVLTWLASWRTTDRLGYPVPDFPLSTNGNTRPLPQSGRLSICQAGAGGERRVFVDRIPEQLTHRRFELLAQRPGGIASNIAGTFPLMTFAIGAVALLGAAKMGGRRKAVR
jgi:hypothetical protein